MYTLRPKLAGVAALAALTTLPSAAAAFLAPAGHGSRTDPAIEISGSSSSSIFPGSDSAVHFRVDNGTEHALHLQTLTLMRIRACPEGDRWQSGACTHAGREVVACESFDTRRTGDLTANFSMAPVAVDETVAPGEDQPLAATGMLRMNDLRRPQDSCKNVQLTLIFAART